MGSDFLGDSAVWVCAFLPVWSASPCCLVVCILVPRGPPDVCLSEGGRHLAELRLALSYRFAWSGLWAYTRPGFLTFCLFQRQMKHQVSPVLS